jgi:EmrB/QacA subfamily drug resistance transporter
MGGDIGDAATKKAVLVVATLTAFLTPFMASSINIALPAIERDFRADAVLLAWVATSFLLPAAVLLLPFGRLADIHGRKKIFGWGIAGYTAASFLCGLSPSILSLIAFRVLQGAAGAMIFATGVAMLTSVFPVGERGKVLGLNVAAVYLGLSLGPPLGGLLTQSLGWRSVFLANVPLGAIILALVLWSLKADWAEARGERFDLAGTLLYSLSLTLIMYGVPLLTSRTGSWLVVLGLLGLAVFFRWEQRVEHPVLDVNLLRGNTVFTFSNLAALINYCATFAVTFLLSLYLQFTKGLGPRDAGLILVAQPLVMAAFSPVAGRLSDRIEPRTVASLGMAFTVLGLALLALLGEGTSLGFIVATLVILGFGFALFSSPNTNAVMSSVDRRFYGVASGTLGTMRLSGQMLSMGIATLIFALYLGRVRIAAANPASFLYSLKVAFAIFAILCFCGIFASLARGRLK